MNKPWETEPSYKTWFDERTGLRCAIVRKPYGHLCGYVRIPRKLRKKILRRDKYPNFGVHGDISYAGKMQWVGRKESGYWVGFDCGHPFDYSPHAPKYWASGKESDYKTWKYVTREVMILALLLNRRLREVA